MLEIIGTEDGSHSLYDPELDETYHSRHGAIQESEHVFIKHGLRYMIQSPRKFAPLNLLEIGFGTGLNALLSYRLSARQAINYTSLETFPLKLEIIEKLNYGRLIQDKSLNEVYLAMHKADWNQEADISENFVLRKIETALQQYSPQPQSFDLVYFDAFAPKKQPELWTLEMMEKMFAALKHGGALVTYCAKGQLKRDLRSAGFEVETLQGPPGKLEMTRATKS